MGGAKPDKQTGSKAAIEECFVDIPVCLETASEQEESTDEEAESMIMDVDSLLQPDYSGYTFWSSDTTKPKENRQEAAEIWRTGAGVFLPPTSSGQSFLSSLARRQSDESLQSSLATGHAPFKSGYCRSESALFAESSQSLEPMQFVPSTVISADGSQKLPGAAKNSKKGGYKRRSEGEPTSPPFRTPKKLKINLDVGKESNVGKGRGLGAKKSASKKKTEAELLRLSAVAVSNVRVKKENHETLLDTPASTVSDLPVASSRVRGAKLAGSSKSRGLDDTQTVLQPSSPNLPSRLTKSRVEKLQMATSSDASHKKVQAKSVQKKLALSNKAESERWRESSDKKEPVKIEPECTEQIKKLPVGYRPRKTPKRTLLPEESLQVLKAWAKSSEVVPYPDKETKQKLAEECHLTVYQVDNWLAGARNRTHLIKVPRKLKLMSKGGRHKAGLMVEE